MQDAISLSTTRASQKVWSLLALSQQLSIPQLLQAGWAVMLLQEGLQVRPHLALCVAAHNDVKVAIVRLVAMRRPKSEVLLGTLHSSSSTAAGTQPLRQWHYVQLCLMTSKWP